MSITGRSNKILVDFSENRVTGRVMQGSKALMLLGVNANLPEWSDEEAGDTIFLMRSARVYLYGKTREFMGFAESEAQQIWRPSIGYSNSRQFLFEWIFDFSQIEAIEKLRSGKGVNLVLQVRGDITDNFYRDTLTRVCDVHFNIGQEDWIKFLEDVGFKKIFLMEFELQREFEEEFPEVSGHVEELNFFMSHGKYNKVVAVCRELIESKVKQSDLDRFLNQSFNEYMEEGKRKGMTKKSRAYFILHALRHYSNKAHHFEDELEERNFSRTEAQFVVGATMSLLGALSEGS